MTDDEIEALVNDPTPWAFFNLCKIRHRTIIPGKQDWVSFAPSVEQRDWVETLMGNPEAIDLKGRNIGIGTATQCFHFWQAWRYAWLGTGINTLVVAHSNDTAMEHLARYKKLNEFLPEEIRLEVADVHGGDNATDYKLIVPGTTGIFAHFRAVTAGGRKGEGRGFTQQQLHITEYGFWEKDNYSTLTSAMHRSGVYSVAIESTPGEDGSDDNHFPVRYYQAKKNKEGSGGMVARFYPWTMQESFRAKVPDDFDHTPEERALQRAHPEVKDEHLVWRRGKLGGTGSPAESILRKFEKEYPLTEQEAFRVAKKGGYFPQARIETMLAPWTTVPKPDRCGERIFEDPVPGRRYAAYLDVAGGVGQNLTALSVVDNGFRQVYQWSSDEVGPIGGAEKAVAVAIRYNGAVLDVDRRIIGIAAAERVREMRYRMTECEKYMRRGPRYGKILAQVMANAALQIEMGRVQIRDYWTLKDLQEMPEGATQTRKDTTHYDDGMAFIHALWLAGHLDSEEAVRVDEVRKRFFSPSPVQDRYRAWR